MLAEDLQRMRGWQAHLAGMRRAMINMERVTLEEYRRLTAVATLLSVVDMELGELDGEQTFQAPDLSVVGEDAS